MDYVVINTGAKPWEPQEIMKLNDSAELPTDVPVGSVAYKADLSYMAMFDGTEWVQWNPTGGDDSGT